jgi:hypothetical protein
VAYSHPDLRQSDADFGTVIENIRTLRTARGNVVDLGIPDNTSGGFSHPDEVAIRLYDAAQHAGSFRGMQDVEVDPLRPADHQHRDSATAPNGTHDYSSQQAACSTPRTSMNASDRLAIMKETMRVISDLPARSREARRDVRRAQPGGRVCSSHGP